MVVSASDVPGQAEVIFVIECTAANGAYINELKTNYIVPTLEYFHGGALDEGGGSGSIYGIVTYRTADCHPGVPVSTQGPFTCPQAVVDAIDKLQFIGGRGESRACIADALVTALACIEDLGRNDVPRHILMLCCSPPYTAIAGGLAPPGSVSTVEQAARVVAERGVQLSVAGARRLPALHALFEQAGGELVAAQQRNYAKDPRHLILLRGYSLKERAPSPAPPPVPPSDLADLCRGQTVAPPRPPAPPFPRAPPVRPNWHPQPRQTVYPPGSALIQQLIQQPTLTYPSSAQSQQNMQRMPMLGATPGPSNAPTSAVPSAQPTPVPSMSAAPTPGPSGAPAPPTSQRTYIWTGVLEWIEKAKGPGDQQKLTRLLPCQVSANSKDIEPELKVETWPNKLLMQLMPKQLISNIGGQYLKDSKSVLFHLQQNEALDALTKVMVNGYAGCVHFSPMSSPPQCDIKVLILLYTPDKKAYLGFIPNNQATFVDRLRRVIQQQKLSQYITKQIPGGVNTGAPVGGVGSVPGVSGVGVNNVGVGGVGAVGGVGSVGQVPRVPGPSQSMVQPGQMQQHPQGMMMQGMGGQVNQGGKGPRSVTQLDGLEAARQQNLEKIHQLQQTLEAAHQQEAQFKSQMDIMSHLHIAEQQEQHYKQLEEQRKHQLQQQLMQQQQQQQRQVQGGPGGLAPRIMRPMMPSNPGLRHLLQQQPQYRPGGGGARPPSQPQQFDDVPNYNDFL